MSPNQSDAYRQIAKTIRDDGRQRFGGTGYSRIIFTNGCFDLLHPGHVKLLNECRSLAGPKGAVVVGVNSDLSVKRLKGPTRPLMDERSRCVLLVNLKSVDYVTTFDEDTPLELISHLDPDLIVKGSDYAGKEIVGSKLTAVHLVEVEKDVSTTAIVERIKKDG